MRKNNFPSIETFILFLIFISSIVIYLSRIGLDNNFFLILRVSLFSSSLLLIPFFIELKIKNFFINRISIYVGFMLLIIILNKINNFFEINFSYLFSFLGLIFIFLYIKLKITEFKIINLFLFFIFIMLGLWATSAYYSSHFMHPLMEEKIINGSWAHRDELFHSSVAGMIKTYNTTSNGITNGINGLMPVYYHTFSHYIFAQFSSFIDVNTMTFYSRIFPILVVPSFFLFFLLCAKKINCFFGNYIIKNNIFDKYYFWILFALLFILPLPMYWAAENYQYLRSQSYSLALIFLFMIFYIIIDSYNDFINDELKTINFKSIFYILLISLLFFCISFTKFSFLYLSFMSYIFIYIRFQLFKFITFNILLIFLTCISLLIYYFVIFNFQTLWDSHGFNQSFINRLYDNPYSSDYYKYLIPSFFYIITRLINVKCINLNKIIQNFKLKNIIDVEYLIYISIILLLFPYSFTDGIQIYIAYLFIIANFKIYIDLYNKC